MHLVGCQDQKSQNLEEFYSEAASSEKPVPHRIGPVMLALIARLRALPGDRSVFGLTSHYRLCLLAEDSWKSPWFVIISALDEHNYTVEYLMPERFAPWPNTRVRGEARSEENAVKMIEIAMSKSEGWVGPVQESQAYD